MGNDNLYRRSRVIIISQITLGYKCHRALIFPRRCRRVMSSSDILDSRTRNRTRINNNQTIPRYGRWPSLFINYSNFTSNVCSIERVLLMRTAHFPKRLAPFSLFLFFFFFWYVILHVIFAWTINGVVSLPKRRSRSFVSRAVNVSRRVVLRTN